MTLFMLVLNNSTSLGLVSSNLATSLMIEHKPHFKECSPLFNLKTSLLTASCIPSGIECTISCHQRQSIQPICGQGQYRNQIQQHLQCPHQLLQQKDWHHLKQFHQLFGRHTERKLNSAFVFWNVLCTLTNFIVLFLPCPSLHRVHHQ